MLFLDRASVTLALASWGFFFFFFSVLAAVFGFVALAARAAVAFVRAVAVALAGRVAVVFAGRAVEVALAGFVAVALAGLVAVALAGLAAVLFTGTLAAVGADAIAGGASTTTGAARAAVLRLGCCGGKIYAFGTFANDFKRFECFRVFLDTVVPPTPSFRPAEFLAFTRD